LFGAEELIANHPDHHILIIGQYISQLEKISTHLKLPLITGKTRHEEREKLYGGQAFFRALAEKTVASAAGSFAFRASSCGPILIHLHSHPVAL
jgi:DNA excision repair protein ERCC-3